MRVGDSIPPKKDLSKFDVAGKVLCIPTTLREWDDSVESGHILLWHDEAYICYHNEIMIVTAAYGMTLIGPLPV